MVLLSAFGALLARYAGVEEVVVGTAAAGRVRAELEGLVGLFVNTLPVRVRAGGDPTIRGLVRRVREACLGAYEHQEVPFELIAAATGAARDPSFHPIFQSLLVLQNFIGVVSEIDGPSVDEEGAREGYALGESQEGTAKFDLSLYVEERGGAFACTLEYSTDLFDAATAERMLRSFQNLLESVADDPDQRLSKLSLMARDEEQRLLCDWSRSRDEYTCERGVVELFDEQVALRPEATAFECDGERLTYAELDRRANRLACRLRDLGIGPEVVVGLCVERSLSHTVCLLAIMKAGGVYLPLDPTYPRERLAYMLEDSGAAVVVTSEAQRHALSHTVARQVLLERDGELLARDDDSSLPSVTSADNLAYVIYTSGSTGRPKGVAAQHAQLLNRLSWMWEAYPFAEGEVCCQKTSLNFVDSVWELLGPLLKGVPTVIIPDRVLKDPREFICVLADARVTRIWVVPSLLRALLDFAPELQERLPALKFWVASGEALQPDLLETFRRLMPRSKLYNLYGTSEVWDATMYDTSESDEDQPWRVPIGRPVANTEAYVLDRHLRPVPVGGQGELYVGGANLARGYLKRPRLTAEKFIPHPFGVSPGARLYKTGDLARFLPDGQLEYLGRRDHQIKVRGHRIELGEVEDALLQHAAVRAAAVVARVGPSGETRLEAFVVPDGHPASVGELRAHMSAKLPGYMAPASFVVLDALPLTPNGKVDRRALPATDARGEAAVEYVAPRSPTEEGLASIWAAVLGVERVGANDNFFELGGHSLIAMRVISRVQDAFGVFPALGSFFQNPTVEGMAKAVEVLMRTGARRAADSITPLPREEYQVAFSQDGELILTDELMARLYLTA